MDTLRFIRKFAKKNKKMFLTFSCFMLALAIEVSVSFVTNIANDIEDTTKKVRTNSVNINNLEKNVSFYNGIFRSVVTRQSFNDYVRHTDDRFKEEQSSISVILRDVGTLYGKLNGLEEIVYALNLYEIKKSVPSNKQTEKREDNAK